MNEPSDYLPDHPFLYNALCLLKNLRADIGQLDTLLPANKVKNLQSNCNTIDESIRLGTEELLMALKMEIPGGSR